MDLMERAFNILYYNFCLLIYYWGMAITVYLNPICWLTNIRFYKLGFNIWRQQMEKNYSPFLYQLKYDRFLKYYSFQLLVIFLSAFIVMISMLLQSTFRGIYIYIFMIAGLLFSIIGSYYFIDVRNKYYEFQKEFVKDKKYNQSFLTSGLLIVTIIILYVLFDNK